MGRRKFRLSDMMPNSWFYKLRDMRRAGGRSAAGGASVTQAKGSRSTQQAGTPRPLPAPQPHRPSYYYASRDRLLQPPPAPQPTEAATEDDRRQPVPRRTESPSRSFKRRHRTASQLMPVAQAPDARHRRRDTCIGGDGTGDVREFGEPTVKAPPSMGTFNGKVIASDTDIIFDLRDDVMPERLLRPIVTRPARKDSECRYQLKERRVAVHRGAVTPRTSSASEQGGSPRRSSVSSGRCRLKTRVKSPRLASRGSRKGKSTNPATTQAASPSPRKAAPAKPPLEESFAVVKASVDPRKDFRESMEEMIAEQGIRDAGDLEDLLACYLTLNAAEHHDVIVEVFEEIWVSLASVNP
jgi:uncharacterized protein (TIGR01568 family)